jgi:hypothetical protein
MAGHDPNAETAPYQQKWFTGAHGDVGGGISEELSEVSRKWIKRGAVAAGLNFDGEALDIRPENGAFGFLRGEVEAPSGLLNIFGMADRTLFPEPMDPSDLPSTMAKMVMKTIQDLMQPRKQPSPQDILRLVHASALLRAYEQGRSPAYAPKTLQPLLKALKDPAVQAKVLEQARQLL